MDEVGGNLLSVSSLELTYAPTYGCDFARETIIRFYRSNWILIKVID